MIAYKFLRAGARGPFSGHAWALPDDDAPGPWLEDLDGQPRVCRHGIHACRAEDLPLWITDELYVVELREPVRTAPHKVVASAGRLVSRVGAWDAETASAFAADCTRRVRELAAAHDGDAVLAGYASDAEVFCLGAACDPERGRAAAIGGVISTHAAQHVRGPEGVRVERARQAQWLVERLHLAPAAV